MDIRRLALRNAHPWSQVTLTPARVIVERVIHGESYHAVLSGESPCIDTDHWRLEAKRGCQSLDLLRDKWGGCILVSVVAVWSCSLSAGIDRC